MAIFSRSVIMVMKSQQFHQTVAISGILRHPLSLLLQLQKYSNAGQSLEILPETTGSPEICTNLVTNCGHLPEIIGICRIMLEVCRSTVGIDMSYHSCRLPISLQENGCICRRMLIFTGDCRHLPETTGICHMYQYLPDNGLAPIPSFLKEKKKRVPNLRIFVYRLRERSCSSRLNKCIFWRDKL